MRVYADARGRAIRSATQSSDAAEQPETARAVAVVQDSAYNAWGARVLQTQPYFLGRGSSIVDGAGDAGATRTEVDVLGRPVQIGVIDANGKHELVFEGRGSLRVALTTIEYVRLDSTTTNDAGYTRSEERTVSGLLARVTDAGGAQVAYRYDAFDNLLATRDALSNEIAQSWDLRGRRVSIADPDAGTTRFCYDVLGQLKAQQSAAMRAQAGAGAACPTAADSGLTASAATGWSTYAYDALGRLRQRRDPEYTSTWSYDAYADARACAQGVGKLCEVVTSHGIRRSYAYDGLGRPSSSSTVISAGPTLNSALGYEAGTGRVATQTYPSGVQLAYGYSALGWLRTVSLGAAATLTPLPTTAGAARPAALALSPLLWRTGAVDAWGAAQG